MAIPKHIPSHNANYQDVISYLIMQHDEKTGEALLDKNGDMIERELYYIEGINCDPDNFAELCFKDNIKFNANKRENDVKTHQYIVSFSPEDAQKGLTLEEAQAFGMNLAKKMFPGHRVIVCSHPDGHNGSGNIHVHIVVNSVRFEDRVPEQSYMKLRKDGSVKTSEYKAGCKHQDTAKLRHAIDKEVQDYCRERGYAVAESKPKNKVTNKEHMAKKLGQERLDAINQEKKERGEEIIQDKFFTKKEELRAIINDAASTATNWDEFTESLRTKYTRTVQEHPGLPAIPYPERQRLWGKYKALNKKYWAEHDSRYKSTQDRISIEYERLRERRAYDKKQGADKWNIADSIKREITSEKEKLEALKLNKNIYKTYAEAVRLAISLNMKDEAEKYISEMEEINRRHEGYWVNSYHPLESTYMRLSPSGMEKKITIYSTTKGEQESAQKILREMQNKKNQMDMEKQIVSTREVDLPIDIKITRGAVSFKHPDMSRWVRGKSLGSDYEVSALGQVFEKNLQKARSQSKQKAKVKNEYIL